MFVVFLFTYLYKMDQWQNIMGLSFKGARKYLRSIYLKKPDAYICNKNIVVIS